MELAAPEPPTAPQPTRRRALRFAFGTGLALAIVIGGLLFAGRKQYRTYTSPRHNGDGFAFTVEYPSNWTIHDPTDTSYRINTDDTELTLARHPGLSLQRFWQEKIVGDPQEADEDQRRLHVGIIRREGIFASPDAWNQTQNRLGRVPGISYTSKPVQHPLGTAIDITSTRSVVTAHGGQYVPPTPTLSHVLAIFPNGDSREQSIVLLIESNSYRGNEETTAAYEDLVRTVRLIPPR